MCDWFGDVAEDPAQRLWPFARTGGEGSMAALWLDPDRVTRVVHLGSGSGSLLTCVLADNGLGFRRLPAIGYEEICWSEEFAAPPQPWEPHGDTINSPYRDWLHATFARRFRPPLWKSSASRPRWATPRPPIRSAAGSTS